MKAAKPSPGVGNDSLKRAGICHVTNRRNHLAPGVLELAHHQDPAAGLVLGTVIREITVPFAPGGIGVPPEQQELRLVAMREVTCSRQAESAETAGYEVHP